MTERRPGECVACFAVADRPAKPRPTDVATHPRAPRCATHRRADVRAKRSTQRAARVERVYNIERGEAAALWVFQGEACACGRAPRMRGPEMDHSHECCPAGESCGQCVRGWLCKWCNHELIGFLQKTHGSDREAAAALLRLAAHLLDPPLARLRRGETTPYASVAELAALTEKRSA